MIRETLKKHFCYDCKMDYCLHDKTSCEKIRNAEEEIKKAIPEPIKDDDDFNSSHDKEYQAGYNRAVKVINKKLFTDK